MNAIVAKLKDKKKALGLSNKELSAMSGVPYSTVCRVLANKADGTPNLQTLKDLAKALDVSIDGAMTGRRAGIRRKYSGRGDFRDFNACPVGK